MARKQKRQRAQKVNLAKKARQVLKNMANDPIVKEYMNEQRKLLKETLRKIEKRIEKKL
ncbi:hypothetical protein HYV81_02430 [Candidatus Woesearchaeota archaeon]|nr:hypothetical protein [Candidatus Woesearchaeota archaeon]